MVRKTLLAAASAAAISAVCATATAQAAPILVEIEGPINDFGANGQGTDRVLTVMGISVIVSNDTVLHSPTAVRTDIRDGAPGLVGNNGRYNLAQWFKGEKFPGRSDRGFVGGTAIVLGTFDPDYTIFDSEGGVVLEGGAIIADDVFSEPAENVVLGQITDSSCSNAGCNAASTTNEGQTVDYYSDWIEGNNGVYMVPVFDKRMPAGELLTDELGFDIDLSGSLGALTGREFSVEGYYGDKTTDIDLSGDGIITADEQVNALHYFLLELTGVDPLLLANTDAEVSTFRIDCRDGDEFEVRGGVHSPIDPATGEALDGGAVTTSRVVRATLPNGDFYAQSTPADIVGFNGVAGEPMAGYRLRDRTVAFCAPVVNLEWVDLLTGEVLATLNDVEVEVAP